MFTVCIEGKESSQTLAPSNQQCHGPLKGIWVLKCQSRSRVWEVATCPYSDTGDCD